MKALAIDCAVSKISVAAKNENFLVKTVLDIGTRQSEKLLPTIDYVLKEVGLSPKDLDYTCLTLGPGTFTGLRLGLSTLKALTLANGTPLYGIPSLDAYAWPYKTSLESVLSLIIAKEDEYFYSFYKGGKKLTDEDDREIEEILKQVNPELPLLVCGQGAKDFVESVQERAPLYTVHAFLPENDACDALFEIAEKMIREKKSPLQDYDGPLYVRKSEAEIVLEQKKSLTSN